MGGRAAGGNRKRKRKREKTKETSEISRLKSLKEAEKPEENSGGQVAGHRQSAGRSCTVQPAHSPREGDRQIGRARSDCKKWRKRCAVGRTNVSVWRRSAQLSSASRAQDTKRSIGPLWSRRRALIGRPLEDEPQQDSPPSSKPQVPSGAQSPKLKLDGRTGSGRGEWRPAGAHQAEPRAGLQVVAGALWQPADSGRRT